MELSELQEIRRQKADALRERGLNPYSPHSARTHTTADAIDRKITAINCITGLHPTAAMIPIAFESDREVITNALHTCGLVEPPDSRVIQITDTLHLAEVLVSEAYLPQIAERSDLQQISEPAEMAFDASDNLQDVVA